MEPAMCEARSVSVMKKNVFVRILAALGGLTLWMMGLGALAETFFGVPLTTLAGRLLCAHTPVAVLLTLLLAILLCAFGTCCWMLQFTKRAAKRTGFVMQKGENGAIGVSVRSIEGLVQTCVRQHDVISKAEISVVERRDGIVILLNIEEKAGVNIPLAVGALQKQIKQYVSTCTGVDVHEVRVLVENTEDTEPASPYTVQEPVVVTAVATAAVAEAAAPVGEPAPVEVPAEEIAEELVQEDAAPAEMYAEATVAEEEPAVVSHVEEAAPVVQAVPVVMPEIPELPEEEDDRPLHQRLFGAEEEPVFVPAPPELMAEHVTKETAEESAEEAAEIVEEPEAEIAEEAFEGSAVLEVVAAMAEEAEAADAETEEQEELL